MNRWFQRVEYTPFHAPPAMGIRAAQSGQGLLNSSPSIGSALENYDSKGRLSRTTGRTIRHSLYWISLIVSLAAGVVAIGNQIKLSELLSGGSRVYAVHDADRRGESLDAVKLERAVGDTGAESLLKTAPSGSRSLYADWNQIGASQLGGRRHFVHGVPFGPQRYRYVPLPRRGLEREFENLEHLGLAGLTLHEIRIPNEWTEAYLKAEKHQWANGCGVKPDWIDQWSAFRISGRLQNECKIGGVCFVIAPKECDADTWESLR